jgi:hypothetical protein
VNVDLPASIGLLLHVPPVKIEVPHGRNPKNKRRPHRRKNQKVICGHDLSISKLERSRPSLRQPVAPAMRVFKGLIRTLSTAWNIPLECLIGALVFDDRSTNKLRK